MAVSLFISFTAFCLFFAAHIIIWRRGPAKIKSAASLIKISLPAYLFIIFAAYFFLDVKLAGHIWVSCPLYMVFVMLYLHFYLGIDRSVSIRILGELYEAKGRSMDFKSLQSKYSQDYMAGHRLEELVESSYLAKKGGEYACTAKGRFIAKFNMFFRKLYLIETTG